MKKNFALLLTGLILGIIFIVVLNRFFPLGNIFRSSGDSAISGESENSFFDVTKKLDTGSDYYGYINAARINKLVKNSIDGLKDIVFSKLEKSAKGEKNVEKPFNLMNKLLTGSGVLDIDGIGFSVKEKKDNIFRSRFIVHKNKKDSNGLIWNLFENSGGTELPLSILPSETVFASFSDISLTSVKKWVWDIADQSGIKEFKNGLKQIESNLLKSGINIKNILNSVSGFTGIVVTLDEKKMIEFPGMKKGTKIPEPAFAFVLNVKNSYLIDLIAEKVPVAIKSKSGGVTRVTFKGVPKLPFDFTPQIVQKGNKLIYASNGKILSSLLDSGKKSAGFIGSNEFKKLSSGMPSKGNSFTFLSNRLGKLISSFVNITGNAKNPAFGFLKKLGIDMKNISVFRVVETGNDGFTITSNSTLNPEAAFFIPVAMTAGIVSAIAIPQLMKAKQQKQSIFPPPPPIKPKIRKM